MYMWWKLLKVGEKGYTKTTLGFFCAEQVVHIIN